jgi:hypothetical protein
MQNGIGFFENASPAWVQPHYRRRVEGNAIHLARTPRAFTVRRDELARQT